MPLGAEGSDKAFHDGLLTTLATWGKLFVVALSAKGLPVLLVEPLRTEVIATKSAEEVLFVPSLV